MQHSLVILLVQVVLIGILVGGFYGLISSCMSLLWGVADIINVAMITFSVLGAYLSFQLMVLLRLNPLIALAINVGLFFVLGLAVQWGLVILTRVREPLRILLVFYGISIALENIILMIWGPNDMSIATGYSNSSVVIPGGYVLPDVLLISFVLSISVFPLLELFLGRTQLGRAIRASGEDKTAASLSGINTQYVDVMTSGISAVLAVVAGFILAELYPFYPTMDVQWVNIVLPVVVLGGAGSLMGTLVAGLIIGITQSLIAAYFEGSWLTFIAYGALLIVLLLRPKGLFGK